MLNTSDVSRPKRYFGFHYILLRFLGLGWWHHPDENDTRNFPGLYFYYALLTELVWVVIFVGLESIDPFIGHKDLDRFMFSLSFVVTHDLTLIKLYIFFFKNRELQDIVRILEIDLEDYYQNNGLIRRTIRVTKILTASFLFFGWLTIGNTTVYGIVQDIKWKREILQLNESLISPPRTLPQPIYIPWNYEDERPYIFTYAFETIGLLWTGHIVMTIDTFIGSVILHMSCQFTILQEAFLTAYDRVITNLYQGIQINENSVRNSSEHINSRDNLDIKENVIRKYKSDREIEEALMSVLKSCFKQHQLLISCVEKFSMTYSYGFVTQLLSSMAAICAVMVQVSLDASSFKSVRLITSLAFFAAMITQLAIQCFTGNELTYQARRVADAVMECKWERMPPRVRKMLLLTILRAQRPLHLTAAGFANMNNDCFLSIMKAAYSYYAVLSKRQA
ncbi:PREDICTED: odorant receptor 94a-like [Papilio polytes]|uniref:odorant receptor 94a-like n=1 Tax=Papilio polytes TaxID=76194 RepID=UPI00067602F3|nr:PREDICTED: odorant receptor 94a-like [Papilio polytes]WCC57589.1 odorant receptor 6 [Papilio polytes]